MKRFFMFVTAVVLIFSLTACGGSSEKKKSDERTSEVAMIVDGEQLAEGSVDQSTWLSVKTLADENGLKLTKTMIGNRPGRTSSSTGCPVLQAWLAAPQKTLGIELTNYAMSSTDANAPMSHNIPATCLCSGGKGIGAHTLKEHFIMEKTELGPSAGSLNRGLH